MTGAADLPPGAAVTWRDPDLRHWRGEVVRSAGGGRVVVAWREPREATFSVAVAELARLA